MSDRITSRSAELTMWYLCETAYNLGEPNRAQIDIREYDITHASNPRVTPQLIGCETRQIPVDHAIAKDYRWEPKYSEPTDDEGYVEVLGLPDEDDIDGWLKPALEGK